MSLTPMEMLTQRSGLQMAAGTVVIGGLGLGWLLRKACEKDGVDRVILVELSEEILDWYGYNLCSRFEVADVICDDVYSQLGRHGDDAMYLLDSWSDAKVHSEILLFNMPKLKAHYFVPDEYLRR